MARKDRLPAARAGKHASGDPLRVSGGHAGRVGRRGPGSGIRNGLWVGVQFSEGKGGFWPSSPFSGGLVPELIFFFPWHLFFLKIADEEKIKLPNEPRLWECLPADD